MDTKKANNLPQEAGLEETLTEAVNLTAENQQPDSSSETPEEIKPKIKRASKAKVAPKPKVLKEKTEAKPKVLKEKTEAKTVVKAKAKAKISKVEVDKADADTLEIEVALPKTETTETETNLANPETPKVEDVSEESIQAGTKPDDDEEISSPPVSMSKMEIIELLKTLTENATTDIKEKIDSLKQSFYKIHKQEVEVARRAFLEAGNAIENFIAEQDHLETDFKALLNNWREKRAERQAEQEKSRKTNFEKKTQIIEEIKALTDSNEDIGKNFIEFRKLQQTWKEIGAVSQDQVNELWKRYQMQIERFYDLLKINNEFREYDFKKNLEIKTVLCETAEKLAEETDVVIAFRQLQKLHEEWRETGPVSKEYREDIWNRFKNASSVINKNHQGFFERLKTIESQNQSQKTAICEAIEAIDFSLLKSYKEWDTKTAEIIELQEQWKVIGFAPKKINIVVFERFRSACDLFFRKKSEFYKVSKDILNQNLEKKKGLCEKAETMKESTDWRTTSDLLIQIQKEWKTIGPVPKKFSDVIWKRFIAACDFFFEQKEKNAPSLKNEEQKNLTAKKELIEQMEAITIENPDEETFKLIRELTAKWNTIGHVPFKEKDKVYKTWHDAVDKQMERLHQNKNNRRSEKFRQPQEEASGKSQGKVLYERERLLRQFDHLTNEIKTSENNIGFFTMSKSSGGELLKEMNKKIESLKEERDVVYKKIKSIDEQL